MGKSMLLHRIGLAIRSDPELSRLWRPVILPEESYGITTEGEFWLKALSYAFPKEEQNRWQPIIDELKAERDEYRLRNQSIARLKDIGDAHGQRLLVMVENFNTILSEQSQGEAGWDLRKTLLNEPAIMLLASATVCFDEIVNANKSMFELYREIKLNPIRSDECVELWRVINGEVLTTEKARPLQILTGGSPRLLTILASLNVGKSFRNLLDELTDLIDDLTPYFKANVESLPALERKVFSALADIWSPAGAKEISELARLGVSKTSALLKRLVSRGVVTEVDRKGRKIFYEITERLYNIYHIMRQSSSAADRARAAVDFMVSFYDPIFVGSCVASDACTEQGIYRDISAEAFTHLINKYGRDDAVKTKILSASPKEIFDFPEVAKLIPQMSAGPRQRVLNMAGDLSQIIKEAIELGKKDPLAEIKQYDDIIAQFGESNDVGIVEQVAWALVNKGVTLGQMNRAEEALSVYEDVVHRFGDRPEAGIVERVVRALYNKGVTLRRMNRFEEELSVYEELVRRFGDRHEASIVEPVARALFSKGVALSDMNRVEEALRIYEDVVCRFGDRPEAGIVTEVVRALFIKGLTLDEMNRAEEALSVYEEVVRRFGDRPEEGIVEPVALALCNKGVTLGEMNRAEEAIHTFEDVARLFGDRLEAGIVEQVAMALFNKGVALGRMNRAEEALNVYENVVRRFGDRPEGGIVEPVARALFNKGVILGLMNRSEEALGVYEVVVRRYGDRPEAGIVKHVARALVNKGYTLGRMNRAEEALSAYEDVVDRFGDRTEAEIVKQVARAHFNKMLLLLERAEVDQAIEDFNAFLRLIDKNSLPRTIHEEAIDDFIELASRGFEKQILELMVKTSAEKHYEPLSVALKMLLNKEYRAPQEIIEVAKDVVNRIVARRNLT
jgi:tetratricopeptide (TPR) repeat protein